MTMTTRHVRPLGDRSVGRQGRESRITTRDTAAQECTMDPLDRSDQDIRTAAFVQGVRIGRSVAAAEYAAARRGRLDPAPAVDIESVGEALDALVVWE